MKAKVKFDKNALIRFFTENGEKIVFGIVVLVFLMFLWSAIQVPRYDKTPEDIQKVADRAKLNIQQASSEITGVDIPDYLGIIREINKPIPDEPYQLATNWRSSIFPPLRKRTQPTLERVEDLVAIPGHGRFKDTSRGSAPLLDTERPEGKRWIVLTGLLNMEKLRKSYKEAFEDVHPTPATYEPEFFREFYSFQVQRAEITEKNQASAVPQWETLWDVVQYDPSQIEGGISRRELSADPNCLAKPILFPLPDRTDRPWGEEVLHAPEIPMIRDSENPAQESMHPRSPSIVPGLTDIRATPPEDHQTATDAIPEKTCPYVLFRFFDFNVQPGKKYRYRVRVYLKNPNYGLSPDDLAPELAKLVNHPERLWNEYIATDWSKASKVVHMPPDDNLLLVGVTRSNSIDAEPSATITAVHWDYMKGTEIFDNVENILPGEVVNLFDQDMPTNGSQTPPPNQEEKKVNYITNMLVLDLKGDGSLPGRTELHKPSSVLLLTPSGSIMVRSSIADEEERERLENPQPDSDKQERRRR